MSLKFLISIFHIPLSLIFIFNLWTEIPLFFGTTVTFCTFVTFFFFCNLSFQKWSWRNWSLLLLSYNKRISNHFHNIVFNEIRPSLLWFFNMTFGSSVEILVKSCFLSCFVLFSSHLNFNIINETVFGFLFVFKSRYRIIFRDFFIIIDSSSSSWGVLDIFKTLLHFQV